MTESTPPPIYVAKISDFAGQRLIQEFDRLTDAIRWACGPMLKPGERSDIYLNGVRVWTKNPHAKAETLLAKLAADGQ